MCPLCTVVGLMEMQQCVLFALLLGLWKCNNVSPLHCCWAYGNAKMCPLCTVVGLMEMQQCVPFALLLGLWKCNNVFSLHCCLAYGNATVCSLCTVVGLMEMQQCVPFALLLGLWKCNNVFPLHCCWAYGNATMCSLCTFVGLMEMQQCVFFALLLVYKTFHIAFKSSKCQQLLVCASVFLPLLSGMQIAPYFFQCVIICAVLGSTIFFPNHLINENHFLNGEKKN